MTRGLLLEEVLVNVADPQLVCVEPKALFAPRAPFLAWQVRLGDLQGGIPPLAPGDSVAPYLNMTIMSTVPVGFDRPF